MLELREYCEVEFDGKSVVFNSCYDDVLIYLSSCGYKKSEVKLISEWETKE